MRQDVQKKFDAATAMIHALCTPRGVAGHRDWVMRIPAEPDYDPDLVIGDALRAMRAEVDALVAERDELLYHTRHASPDDVEWHSPKTVGHLRRQLAELDPNMAIGCAYFLDLDGVKVARTTGVSMSYERVDNERNRIDSGNSDIPKGIIIWAHSTDEEGLAELRGKR